MTIFKTPYFFFLIFFFSISCYNGSGSRFKSEKFTHSITGKVVSILDGDTYDILTDGNKTTRIRMEGIDAPEKGMPYYRVSKKYLANLCFGKTIRLDIEGKDVHERTLAFSYLEDGTELSHAMIKAGLAWHFKEYSSDTSLSNLEIKARNLKLGIWADDNPMPPWENRKLHREGISTKGTFDTKEAVK